MSLNFESGQRGYTGKILEYDYFGQSVHPNPEIKKFLQEFGKPTQDGKVYLPFNKSIEFIKKFYAQDPHNPEKPVANELFQVLLKKLKLENSRELSFYSAIDTPLDTFHKIDGFFEHEGVRLTVDLTANPKKEDTDENTNVDIVLHELPDPAKDSANFTQAIDSCAQELARVWKNKKRLAERENRWSAH